MRFILIPLLIIFGVVGVFSVITSRFANPYKLYLVFGKKGSGKTTLLIKKAIHYLNRGWYVYTNIDDMNVPGVRHIDATKLGEFTPVAHSVLLIDEINLFWDNRDYKTFSKSTQKFFRLQRHYKVMIFCASQTYDCDKKIRDQTDMMYLCICWRNVFSIARPIIKKPVITVSDSSSESRVSEDLKMLPFWNWEITLIPRYKKYYDSFATEPLPEFEYTADPMPSARRQFRQLRKYFRLHDARTKAGESEC